MSLTTLLHTAIDKVQAAQIQMENLITRADILMQTIALNSPAISSNGTGSVPITISKIITVGVSKDFATINEGLAEARQYRVTTYNLQVKVIIDAGVYPEDLDLHGILVNANLVLSGTGVTIESNNIRILKSHVRVEGEITLSTPDTGSKVKISKSHIEGEHLKILGFADITQSNIKLANLTANERSTNEVGDNIPARLNIEDSYLRAIILVPDSGAGILAIESVNSTIVPNAGSILASSSSVLSTDNCDILGDHLEVTTSSLTQDACDVQGSRIRTKDLVVVGRVNLLDSSITGNSLSIDSENLDALIANLSQIKVNVYTARYLGLAVNAISGNTMQVGTTNLQYLGTSDQSVAECTKLDNSIDLGTINWVSGETSEPITLPTKDVIDSRKNLITYEI